jgi:hypothetical protein
MNNHGRFWRLFRWRSHNAFITTCWILPLNTMFSSKSSQPNTSYQSYCYLGRLTTRRSVRKVILSSFASWFLPSFVWVSIQSPSSKPLATSRRSWLTSTRFQLSDTTWVFITWISTTRKQPFLASTNTDSSPNQIKQRNSYRISTSSTRTTKRPLKSLERTFYLILPMQSIGLNTSVLLRQEVKNNLITITRELYFRIINWRRNALGFNNTTWISI